MTTLPYLIAGQGPPVLRLHGFAESSPMWLPLIAKLAATKLNAPMLVLTGEKASGHGLIEQAELVDGKVKE